LCYCSCSRPSALPQALDVEQLLTAAKAKEEAREAVLAAKPAADKLMGKLAARRAAKASKGN